MSPLRALRDGLTDDSLRVAILAGLATVPFTLALSWISAPDDVATVGGTVSGEALLLAGLIVGYYYSDRETENRRAGIWTGLAGSIAVVLLYVTHTITTIGSHSSRWTAVIVVLTPVALVIGVGLTVLVTMVAAQLAGWVTTRLDRDRRVSGPAGGDDRTGPASKYWKAVAAYVLVAPPVLGYVLLELGENDVGFLLSALGMLFLVPLSIVAFVALFIDATAPQERGTGWLPSVWAYVGGPLGVYVGVYSVATLWGVGYPPGYAIYSFFGALWLASAVYLVNRHRYFDAGGSASGQPG
ncbi:DUF5518 domain-containing protein [Natronorubrum halophilum]|uniref:DUF5518 domain-containing protein n=1 Tax=Natronorubrum halophilum TaxID=1702106 RepID=UPI0010C23341|nr:DUF5518 domain-containing protein [Natronorubrum halophilum]